MLSKKRLNQIQIEVKYAKNTNSERHKAAARASDSHNGQASENSACSRENYISETTNAGIKTKAAYSYKSCKCPSTNSIEKDKVKNA